MSHTVKRQSQCTDVKIIERAAKALPNTDFVGDGLHKFFGGSARGIGVKLPGWRYPVVFDTETGEIKMDNYGGQWGDEERLRDFKQRYAVEQGKSQLEAEGYRDITETLMEDGRIRCVCSVGGYGVAGAEGGDVAGGGAGGFDVAGSGGA